MTPQIITSSSSDSALKIKEALSLLGRGNKSVREMRAMIMGLEEVMKSMPEYVPGEDFETTHHFEPGIYMRECLIPKGFIVTGKIHKTGHLNILSKGKITVWTEDGMKTLEAPAVINSKPGIKRVGLAHEDTIWMTVHSNPTDERDIKSVEARLFADSFDEAYLSSPRTFEDSLHFLGFSTEEVVSLSQNTHDMTQFPYPVGVEVLDSPIHGKGLFVSLGSRGFSAGDTVAPGRTGGKRTPAGRYCNHSGDPNVFPVMRDNGDVDLVASRNILAGEEIFNDYYLTYTKTRFSGGSDKCLL